LKIVDTQMMLQRPGELAGDRAREIQRAGMNVNMANEVAKAAQEDKTRVQEMDHAEASRLHTEEDGRGNGSQEGQEGRPRPRKQASRAAKDALAQHASRKLLDLPVAPADKGKFVKTEQPSIDILV